MRDKKTGGYFNARIVNLIFVIVLNMLSSSISMGQTETITVNNVNINMVYISGGKFNMGYDTKSHLVMLSDFYLGETEVTQGLWKAVMGEVNSSSDNIGENFPVSFVSWGECQVFIKKLNEMTGKNFRLPTEAEWEYSARGGNKSHGFKYSGSDNLDEVAWYVKNSGDKYGDFEYIDEIAANHCRTHPVKTKKANELGLYDMSGNVDEWCNDWYSNGSYSSTAQINPKGSNENSFDYHVCRGGGCYSYNCSVWIAGNGDNVDGYTFCMGFRLAMDSENDKQSFVRPVPIGSLPCPGINNVKDIEGNTYNTVQIGEQCWMSENLRVTRYPDGTSIEKGEEKSMTSAYWYYPNNDSSTKSTYGLLYNWAAVMHGAFASNSNPSGVQGICPNGWHVPSAEEWKQLENSLSNADEAQYGWWGGIAGKLAGGIHGVWCESLEEGTPGNYNYPDRNITGFSAVPAGIYPLLKLMRLGVEVDFYSTKEFSETSAYCFGLRYSSDSVFGSRMGKDCGCSVRCVKDN